MLHFFTIEPSSQVLRNFLYLFLQLDPFGDGDTGNLEALAAQMEAKYVCCYCQSFLISNFRVHSYTLSDECEYLYRMVN